MPGRRGGGASHLPPERGRRGGGSPGSPLLPPPPSPPPGFASAIAPLRSPPAPPSAAPGCMVHGARAPLRRSSGRSRVLSAAAAERWVKDPSGPPAATAARPIEGSPGALLALRDPPCRAGGPGARGWQAGSRRAGAGSGTAAPGGRSECLVGPGRPQPRRALRVPAAAHRGPRACRPRLPGCSACELRSERSGAERASRQAEVGHPEFLPRKRPLPPTPHRS